VLGRHVLRNALVPIVTVLSQELVTVRGGAVVTETVFAWPGLGTLIVQAINQRDYPVVQAAVLLSAVTFLAINLATDLVNYRLNPHLRLDTPRPGA
ncbi:MAG: ABC transporter permease, partial [Armatimonadetes bacterium]|nr:ABC transporter permease [Armatimonadota bacterium]